MPSNNNANMVPTTFILPAMVSVTSSETLIDDTPFCRFLFGENPSPYTFPSILLNSAQRSSTRAKRTSLQSWDSEDDTLRIYTTDFHRRNMDQQ